MGGKFVSPCLDVCKYKRGGSCIACAMTKKEKSHFKKLDGGKKKRKFLAELVEKQSDMGGYTHWEPGYRRKCKKKGEDCPLDDI